MSVLEILGTIAYGMVIGVALAAPIGPINIEIITRGLRHGFLNGWLIGMGALTADTLYATIVVSGFAPIADRPALRAPLFLAGTGMLGLVGFRSVRNAVSPAPATSVEAPRGHRSYGTGFLMAAFNPMSIVYWLSVGAALVAESVDRLGRVGAPVLVTGVFLGLFMWVTSLAIVATMSRRFVTGVGMRWVTGMSGVILIGFATWFLVQGIQAVV